ncbi:LrgB-like family-domain-containing protein [Annulohypoxylon maeteangense]|uniref:LrgB-like family-domain-containing protein n=1 Tax=Annulohypoxylon maeteangense TaxID=1927788 RepID=UPI0020080D88|nr:LrgB-like family-domain-containing protein [Annulohypoxylon maeteangense]KAI0882049.1 LrgB-like family-domain-containing protein [Annulohypoxylon maeteangense]
MKRFRDAGMGIVFIFLNQLLVVPIQIVLDLHSFNIPASVLVMLLFWVFMIVTNYIHTGTAQLYNKHLRGTIDFLGRHMSFGFVASFIMLNKDRTPSAIEVSKIAGAFLITTAISYIGAYLVTSGSFKLEQQFRGQQTKVCDLEDGNKSWPRPSTALPTLPTEASPRPLPQLSRLSVTLVKNKCLTSIEPVKRGSTSQFIDHLVRTSPIWICFFILTVVGIPVSIATRYDTPFESLCFVLFWILSVQFQRSLKSSCRLQRSPRLRSTIVILANPVMVTWALGTGYIWIKTAYTKQTIDVIISEFHRHNTLSEGIMAIVEGGNLTNHIGAGDLFGPVLDAGIVCLGFKMFEYRKELWESFVTVFTTCAILAVVNVFLNVLIARVIGLKSTDALAFAARSVTIALGVPAIQNLGGSATIMSAMVIFGGILFQMAGNWVFSIMRIQDQECQQASDSISDKDVEKGFATERNERDSRRSAGSDNAVIAAGVTVGINAAAMGTAHLIERDSRATAYSALSMTLFGAMTVALTAFPGVSEAVIYLANL